MDMDYYWMLRMRGESSEKDREAREAYLTAKLGKAGKTGLHEDGSVAYDEVDPEEKIRVFLQRDMPEVTYESFEAIWMENESLRDRIIQAQRAYDQEHEAASKNYRLYTVAVWANKDVKELAKHEILEASKRAHGLVESMEKESRRLADNYADAHDKLKRVQSELKAAKLKIKSLQKPEANKKKVKRK
jgi:hypothetical protein